MGLSIYNLIKAAILVLNALAVLHERRFLPQFGMGTAPAAGAPGSASPFAMPPDEAGGAPAWKTQLDGLLTAVRYMRMPLVFFNIFIILIEMLLG